MHHYLESLLSGIISLPQVDEALMTGPGADLFAFIAQKVGSVLPQQTAIDDSIYDPPTVHAQALITDFTT
jgi:hypothetical protein